MSISKGLLMKQLVSIIEDHQQVSPSDRHRTIQYR